MDANDPRHKNIKILLLILGGGNLGVNSAAACYALHLMGLGYAVDIVVGISTGAWVGAYHLAGLESIKTGNSIYYKPFASSKYISLKNFPFLMNASIIENTTSMGSKKLDINAVYRTTSDFFVGVTDINGTGHFLDVKKANPSPWSALYASSAIPLAYKKPLKVNNGLYMDGGIALPFPIQKVMRDFSPTHVLVLPNCPQEKKHIATFTERIFVNLFLTHLTSVIKTKTLLRHQNFVKGIDFANNAENIHILWPPNMDIHELTRNPNKLRAAAEASVKHTLKEFGKPELQFELY